MLIPIRADVQLRARPIGNWAILALNVAVFVLGDGLDLSVVQRALPALDAGFPSVPEYLTYQFRHGNLTHLLGNMLFLWIFGAAVCDRMGSINYVMFYLAGGVCAGVVFAMFDDNKLVGASGAIAAVTTAFLVLFPRVHVTLILWLFFFVTTIQVPSMLLIVGKIILWDNIFAPSLNHAAYSSVAYSAHLGGYAFGFVVSLGMLAIRALPRNQFDLLALLKRWNRRTGLVGEAPFTPAARPVRIEELSSRPIQELRVDPLDQLREDILDRMAEHDLDEAARLYRRLIERDARQALPKPQQIELANHLAQSQQHAEAVAAYEAFIAAYPGAAEAPQVRLLVGLIYRRRLSAPAKAAEHLRVAFEQSTREPERQLAWEELQLAEAASGGAD